MDNDDKLLPYSEHLNEIIAALSKRDAYLFIGAGFSMNAKPKTTDVHSTFKTWTTFMEQLAKRLWPGLNQRELEKKVAGNHLYIAQLYEEEYGTSAFYKELLQAVPYKDFIPSPIHNELIGLDGWKGFITTNQDCLIEQSLERLHIYHDVIISDLDIATKPANTKVFKLHGSMERPESIIFTEEQYRTYEQNHPLLYVKVKSIFAEHCVVFVGFSLTDANFKAIYGWVKDVLQSDYQRKAYAFVREEDIDPYTKRYWEKRNIILLPIFTKQDRNIGRAFQQSLMKYIDKFKREPSISEDNVEYSLLYDLLDSSEWQTGNINELLHLVHKAPSGRDFRFADQFARFLKKHGPSIDQKDLFLLLESIYQKQLLPPLFSIEGRSLIDRLIKLLEKGSDADELLYQYNLEKSEALLRIGEYEEVEQFLKVMIEMNGSLPVEMRNSYLYVQIIIEKYRMNFKAIHILLRQLVIDWEQPIWLNRLASVYLFLGEKSMALNLYNRAIQVAEEKRDDWNLYLANFTKLYLMRDLFDSGFFPEKEKKEVQVAVRRLSQRLKETSHPTFEHWQQFDELKAKWWSDYKNWKSQLGDNQVGFNSLKGDSIYQVYEMISFYEMNGFPHATMIGNKFDVILDIFIENRQRVRGASFAILFGHDKQIAHAFRFGALSEITEAERTLLYNQSLEFAENVIWYIQSLRENSYYYYVEMWLPALIQCWSKLIPILKDEEIDQIANISFQLFQEIEKFPKVDMFTNARRKLITVFSQCLFYRQHSIDRKRILEILRKTMGDFRLVGAFLNMDWNDFEKESISNDILKGIIARDDNSTVKLIEEWLDSELLSAGQKQLVFQEIYEQNRGDKELQRARFLYLRFFKNLLDANTIQEIVEYGIDQFRGHLSSSNGSELYQLAQHVEQMNDSHVNSIIEGIENKIGAASSSTHSTYIQQEIISLHAYFLHKLWKAGKIEELVFLKVFSNVAHLERNMANLVAELAHEEMFSEMITDQLLQTSYSFQVKVRKSGHLLIGFWLKERMVFEERERHLLDRILVGLDDSNVEVASEAVRGMAFILRDNPSIIPFDVLERMVRVTERGINRSEISYLTNLAFLYKELAKQEGLHESLKEVVTVVLTQLSQSSFSNVRRECHLT